MELETSFKPAQYEQTILAIIRRLPPERLPSLIEFAHFLEFQTSRPVAVSSDMTDEIVLSTELTEDDKKWDVLLEKPKAKTLLRAMAKEARAEYLAGNTTDIQVDEAGQLKPV